MEIKAKDFRIGNYYLDENCQLIEMSGYALWQFSIKENLGRHDEIKKLFNPILLTEEWMLKLGFIKEEGKKESAHHGPYFSIWVNDYKYSFAFASFRGDWGTYIEYTDSPFEEDENKKYPFSSGIKYVHQIQNFFYTAEEEELQLKFTSDEPST